MKTLLNLLNRTANAVKISGGGNSRTTKHLFAIVTLLLTFGVGNMWAGKRRIYFDYSAVAMWKDYTNLSGGEGHAKVHCWRGDTGNKDYEMFQVEGEDYLAYCDIDDGWTSLCFFRCGSDGTWWTKTYNYDNFGSKNYFKIKNDYDTDGVNRYKWDSATRWVPGVCIDGLIDVNNPHLQPFTFEDNDGTYEVNLSAHTTYQFCILDGSTRYTVDNNVWSGTIPGYTLGTTGYDIRLATAGAGTYTFEYNKSTHVMKVTYPTVNHPSIDYCYLYKFNDWTHHYLHIYDSESSIEGTTYPGTEIENYFEIGDDKYYYFAPGDYANCQPNDNNDSRKVNPAASTSAGLGKFQKYITDSWGWRTFTVRIQLNDLGAGTAVNPTYMDVAFNSDVLDDLTSIPVKNGYTFGGFYSGYDEVNEEVTGVQVIDDSGNWITSVSDYTDASTHWIHAGMSTTIYAKWTEDKHTVNVAVSPAGAGSVQVNSSNVSTVTNVGISTKSAEMTPIALPGWKFKEWQATSNVQMDLVNYHSDYQQGTDNKMKINATADGQTLTAVFEPRYYLVGGELVGDEDNITTSGMPGWGNYDAPFIVTTSSPLLATCTRTLTNADKTYKILVRDKNDGISYGVNTDPFEVIQDGESLLFDDANYKVFLYAKGGTTFTFKITDVDASGHPYVSLDRPHQMHMGHKRVDIDGTSHNDDTGGTLTASTGGNDLENGDWYNYNVDIAFEAAAETGYSLTWYTNSDYSSAFSPQPGASWTDNNVTGDENVYAKFTEKVTTVNLAANGYGHIEINDTPSSETTCGVTTTRSLTAVPNDGYYFTGWSLSSSPDFQLDDKTSDTDPEVTLRGKGDGNAGTLTANFALRYSLKGTMNSENWGTDHKISNIATVGGKAIGYVDITLAANTSYEFAIYDLGPGGGWLKDNNTQVYNMTNGNSYNWDFDLGRTYNCGITTAGAGTYRFMWNITDKTMSVIYPNFVIYRSGDKDEDSERATHTTTSTVESYDGGTVAQGIEFRMKVRELDKWYTLCLPFTVNKVCVWDAEDGKYYEMKPYYRPTPGGTFYTGHYVIRSPYGDDVTGPGVEIELANFDDWRDPVDASVLPSASTPYIIQWHHSYFYNRYISFFGTTGQTIPTSMTSVEAPSANDKVRVCGNDAMTDGSVAGAYMLDNDYGSGAWLRDEDKTKSRTISPFECYILASSETTGKYLIIRRGMTTDDTPTGWDDVLNSERKVRINVYTISGFMVTQFNDCSFAEAAQRLRTECGEGIFILRSENESVKLMMGGK